MKKTRYALCGLSTRGIYHFALPILGKLLSPTRSSIRRTPLQSVQTA